jgi:hypothetical protein
MKDSKSKEFKYNRRPKVPEVTIKRLEEAPEIADLLHKARRVLLSSNIQSRQALKLNIIAHHDIITTQQMQEVQNSKLEDIERTLSVLEARYGIVPPVAKPKTRILRIVRSK